MRNSWNKELPMAYPYLCTPLNTWWSFKCPASLPARLHAQTVPEYTVEGISAPEVEWEMVKGYKSAAKYPNITSDSTLHLIFRSLLYHRHMAMAISYNWLCISVGLYKFYHITGYKFTSVKVLIKVVIPQL